MIERISRSVEDLGTCLIDVYRAPGDLYPSWDIVKQNADGTFDRVPDARYGPDAPDGEHALEDFTPVHLNKEYEVYNQNGWTKRITTIVRADDRWPLAGRES